MRRRRLLLLAWIGVLGTVALIGTIVAGGAKAQSGSCASRQRLPAGHRSPKEQLVLTAADGEAVVLHFGESRSRGVGSVLLSAKGGALFPDDFNPRDGLQATGGDYYVRRDSEHKMYPNLDE